MLLTVCFSLAKNIEISVEWSHVGQMLWYKKTSRSRTTHHVSVCLPTVVKPSGHHLKLALKMRNLAKAMFKPMR